MVDTCVYILLYLFGLEQFPWFWLSPLLSVKGNPNAIAYNDIVGNSVLPA